MLTHHHPTIILLLIAVLLLGGCGHQGLSREQVGELHPYSHVISHVPQDPKVAGSFEVEQRRDVFPEYQRVSDCWLEIEAIFTDAYQDGVCVASRQDYRCLRQLPTYGPTGWMR